MCGRTSLFLPQSVVEARFDATSEESLEPRYNVAPFDNQAVITNADPETIRLFQWGFLPEWADSPESTYRPINARAETVNEKPMFEEAFATRRCLVLVDGFYEWRAQERGPAQPYRITKTEDEPFAMAGLYSRWESNGEAIDSTTIVTTEANDLLSPIHDRMPVILPQESERAWVNGNSADASSLLRPYPESDLHVYPVTTAVNDPANDSAAILKEASVDDTETQTGLDEFS